jgi:hypothetical protein
MSKQSVITWDVETVPDLPSGGAGGRVKIVKLQCADRRGNAILMAAV